MLDPLQPQFSGLNDFKISPDADYIFDTGVGPSGIWRPMSISDFQYQPPVRASINPSSTSATVTSVSGDASGVVFLQTNTARLYYKIFNNSISRLYILEGAGTPSNTNFTTVVGPSGFYEPNGNVNFTFGISGIWDIATGVALITENT